MDRYNKDVSILNRDTENMSINSSIITSVSCEICNNTQESKFIILDCGHIFHIQCLVELHTRDLYDYSSINEEYFASKKCTVCDRLIELDDISHLHIKYMASTQSKIISFTTKMERLETELKVLRNEIKTCLEYKHKLQQAREKSNQIVSILETML